MDLNLSFFDQSIFRDQKALFAIFYKLSYLNYRFLLLYRLLNKI